MNKKLQYFFLFEKALTLWKRVKHFGGRAVDWTVTNLATVADGYGHLTNLFF
jgi:hypothetical protein